ncbi:unnamed protein product [Didymodactylos carnosus]|uniref:G-protein coupled receptors family 1 profile domain-containing protein n=1 Tax=Didymodactylos carnosus TaxID=1234261 RepID=A0A8S2QZR0_9BILA|nr:unnamed protein product [Didymodactylos carnosus]CAF4129908.1 unnamed protein product [Didymodactylos carnosus]
MSSAAYLTFISQQFTIYFGIPVFICGLIGNCLNILMFLSKKLFPPSPCQLHLLTASISSLIAIVIPLLLRILIGLQYDVTKTNLFLCKARQYLGHVSILTSLTCVSWATIDRYLISCRQARFRQISRMSTARLLCVATVVFWSLHGLPIVIMVNIYPAAANQTVCVNKSIIYGYYLNYFVILILYNLLPLAIFVAFGLLTWKNMHKIHRRRIGPQQQRLPTNQRQEYQLTRMLLLQIGSISISTTPYAIDSLYNVITSQIQKDSFRTAQENLCTTVSNFLFYLNFASSFYIYLSSSKSLRNKFFRKLLSIYSKRRQVTQTISVITTTTAKYANQTTEVLIK